MSIKEQAQLNIVAKNREPAGNEEKLPYEAPAMVSYTSEEIRDQAGPAQACSPSPCGIF